MGNRPLSSAYGSCFICSDQSLKFDMNELVEHLELVHEYAYSEAEEAGAFWAEDIIVDTELALRGIPNGRHSFWVAR